MKKGWEVRKLGELAEIELGKTPSRGSSALWDEKRETGNVWLSIADLLNAEDNVVVESKEYVSDKGAALCKLVSKGTLLVSFKLTLGRLAFAGRDLFTNEAIAALTLFDERDLSKDFLFWFLQYFDWIKAAENDVKLKGMTLNKAKLKEIVIHFPKSIAEQQRIVGVLNEAFASLATAQANTEKNFQNARTLFESHVQSVFAQHGKEWSEATLGDEIELLSGFPFKSAHYTEQKKDIRLLRGDNIVQGSLRWEDVKRWPVSDATEYDRYRLGAGDVVLAMDRPWVKAGLKRAQISVDDLPCLLVQRTARLRCNRNLNSRFLVYLIGSDAFVRHILGVQTGIGVPHISGQQIKNFKFSKPPMDVQVQIADRLDALAIEAQRLESIYQQKLAALNELKKSLLHQAFSGNL